MSRWRASNNPLPDPQTDDQLDLDKARLAFVRGSTGAAMDLEVAYEFGSGARRHAGAAAFWHAVVEQLPPAQGEAETTPLKALRAASDLGSVFALSDLADELQRQNGGRPNDEIAALRRRAESGGLRSASGASNEPSSTVGAPGGPVAPPRLGSPSLVRTPEVRAILDRPEYRLPLTNLEQEPSAHAAAMAGVTAAINEGDPAALIAHLAGWMRVRRAAEEMARTDRARALPARDLQPHLLSFVEPARKAGRFGTVFLLRLAMDREWWWSGRRVEERETVRTDELDWLSWRQGALISLPWLMLVASDGDLSASGPAIPPWSPVLRHPAELLARRFVPLLNIPPERLASSDLKSLNTFYRRDPTAVLLTIHAPGSKRAPEIVAGRTRAVTQRVPAVNRNYEREVAERDAALKATIAELDKKLAELDKKIAAVRPVVETRSKKRVLVATERKATYRTRSINENGPGTRQGDQVFTGWVDVPTYKDVVEVQQSPDFNHPLYAEKRKLEAERKNPAQKPAPTQVLATGTDGVTTHYDRWSATPTVAVTLKENGTERTVWLNVPMTYERARSSAHPLSNIALGSASLRRMVANPASLGAAYVHRAVAAFLVEERLKATIGERRARIEAALIGELLFGFEPDEGTVLQALREIGL